MCTREGIAPVEREISVGKILYIELGNEYNSISMKQFHSS